MKFVLAANDPSAFSQNERRRFCELVELGGEVDTLVLAQNVENARALVFARSGGRLLGVAALKRPHSTYRTGIAKKSGYNLDSNLFPFELGYVFVQEDARGYGLSHQLLAAAFKETDGRSLFATARTDNFGMLRALNRSSFLHVGSDYPGRKAGTFVRLLIRKN